MKLLDIARSLVFPIDRRSAVAGIRAADGYVGRARHRIEQAARTTVESLECRTLFNTLWWVTLWPADPSWQEGLRFKQAYDADQNGEAEAPVIAQNAADAIKTAIEGEYTAMWSSCMPGTGTQHTYHFPSDAGVADTSTNPPGDGNAPFNIALWQDAYSGSSGGSITIRGNFCSPYATSEERKYVHRTWNVSAQVIHVSSLGVSNYDNTLESGVGYRGDDGEFSYGSRTGDARLNLNASLSTTLFPQAWNYVRYRVLDSSGGVVRSGALPQAGTSAYLDLWDTLSAEHTVQAWVDGDQDGTLSGDETAVSVLAVSTKFHVKVRNTKPIFSGGGTTEVRIALTFTEGSGVVRVTRINASGTKETSDLSYEAGGAANPAGLILQGKITDVVVVASGGSTSGTITQE